MKIFIIFISIIIYIGLGILSVAIYNKYEHESIEQSNPGGCILFILLWPLVMCAYLGYWLIFLPLELCTLLTNLITKKDEDEE